MAHVSSIVYGRSAVIPFDASSFAWNEFVLETMTVGIITRSKFERTNFGSGQRVIHL